MQMTSENWIKGHMRLLENNVKVMQIMLKVMELEVKGDTGSEIFKMGSKVMESGNNGHTNYAKVM